jgi:phosphohistidine phosphatase SixA
VVPFIRVLRRPATRQERYLLLARHGAVERRAGVPDKEQPLSKEARTELSEVVRALVEQCSDVIGDDGIRVLTIRHGRYKHVSETARKIELALAGARSEPLRLEPSPELDPNEFWEGRSRGTHARVARELEDEVRSPESGDHSAILVVGHQPQLGWIAEEVLGRPLPIARCEVVCIAITAPSPGRRLLERIGLTRLASTRRLVWSIAPSDPDAHKELIDKIKAKMDVAKVLGALILPTLGILLGLLLDPKRRAAVEGVPLDIATVLLFTATGLYLATIYAYDRLLMPVRFWAESARTLDAARLLKRRWLARRPPSSSLLVLHQNMIRVWNWIFTPATIAAIGGLALLAYAALDPGWIEVVIAVGAAAAIVAWYRFFRPVLGTED